MSTNMDESSHGSRIKRLRNRAGMSRTTLGGLVGRSSEWVKAVETGRIQAPRIDMLLRIADVLGVTDLVELTGDPRLATASFGKAAHDQLSTITATLIEYRFNDSQTAPISADELRRRLVDAWRLWHGARRHRTALAVVLPDLLRSAQDAVRRLDDEMDRRQANAVLAECYHLAQLFLSFQPVPSWLFSPAIGECRPLKLLTTRRRSQSPPGI